MRHPNRPMFTKSSHTNKPGLFSFVSIIPQIIIIVVAYAAYYYIDVNEYFPFYLNAIHWIAKGIIALAIVVAAARSLTVPILAMAFSSIALYMINTRGLTFISSEDAWELLIMGAVGFVITFIVRSLRR